MYYKESIDLSSIDFYVAHFGFAGSENDVYPVMKLKLPGKEATLVTNLAEGQSQIFEFKERLFTFTLEEFDKQKLTVFLKED